jgi:hypothetical protein
MNEFQILSYLLSRRGDTIGADESTIMQKLGLKGDEGLQQLYSLLDSYSNRIEIFGLKVERNPLNGYWFLTYSDELGEFATVNPFSGRTRIAMTFISILIAATCNDTAPSIEEIKKIRKKKDITRDLKDLEELGLIEMEKGLIHLTEKVGFFIDVTGFLEKFKQFLEKNY